MSLFVTELRGLAANFPVPTLAGAVPLTLTVGSSVSTGLLTGAGTNMIMVTADTGAWLSIPGSSISTGIVTSTNGVRIPANTQPLFFAVAPFSRLTALST